MPTYSLGSQSFIYANRDDVPGAPPELIQQDVEVFQRVGQDGSAIRKNGVKGQPFQLRTCAAGESLADAIAGQDAYRDMVGSSALTLVFEGSDFGGSTTGTDYVVLNVGQFEIHRVSNLVVDGSITTSAYLLWATWTLLPVAAL